MSIDYVSRGNYQIEKMNDVINSIKKIIRELQDTRNIISDSCNTKGVLLIMKMIDGKISILRKKIVEVESAKIKIRNESYKVQQNANSLDE